MENNYVIRDGELYHWGVKGMKWGVRRYMNKDGTLTPAGKKRYNKELEKVRKEEQVLKNRAATQAKLDRLNTRKQNVSDKKKQMDDDNSVSTLGKKTNDTSEAPKKRTVKDVPDDELRARVNRLQLEKQYKDLVKDPSTVDKGRGFVNKYVSEAGKKIILDNAVDIGSQLVKHYMAKGANNFIGDVDDKGKTVDRVFANNKKKS